MLGKNLSVSLILMLFVSTAFIAVGCAKDDDNPVNASTDVERGKTLFGSTTLGGTDNQFSCNMCHDIDNISDNNANGQIFSGLTLYNSVGRASYKGNPNLTEIINAANACITGWMGGTAVTAAQAEWTDLLAYLKSISPSASSAAIPLVVEAYDDGTGNPDEAQYEAIYGTGGVTATGQAIFTSTCNVCHGAGLNGAPNLNYLKSRSIGSIAAKVRTSGPPLNADGPMPFFQTDRLTTQNLKDIIAYLKS